MPHEAQDPPIGRIKGRSLTDWNMWKFRLGVSANAAAARADKSLSSPASGPSGSTSTASVDKEAPNLHSSSALTQHRSGSTVERILDQYVLSPAAATPEPCPDDAIGQAVTVYDNPYQPRSSAHVQIAPARLSGSRDYFNQSVDAVTDSPHRFRNIVRLRPGFVCTENDDTPTKAVNNRARDNLTSPVPEGLRLRSDKRSGKSVLQSAHPPSGAPSVSLPQVPEGHHRSRFPPSSRFARGVGSPIQSTSTVSNSQQLLNTNIDEHDDAVLYDSDADHRTPTRTPLRPRPLRMHFSRHGTRRASGVADAATSVTDSNESLFEYDRFRGLLHESQEREVSMALRRVSGVSLHSRATICSPDGTPVRNIARSPIIATPLVTPTGGSGMPQGTQPCSSQQQDGFYNPSSIPSAWAQDEYQNTVKVPVYQTAKQKAEAEARHEFRAEIDLLGVHKDDDKDDWETVATSAGPPTGAGLSFTGHTVNSRGLKETGSSIADVSDSASSHHPELGRFASTERILQHPAPKSDASAFSKRTLKDTTKPIFLPKPRIHRVNGRAIETSRPPPPPPKDKSPGGLLRRISNPFSKGNQVPSKESRAHVDYKFYDSSYLDEDSPVSKGKSKAVAAAA
ncbi:hypothetical protein NKR23_g2630 [Pleurostoma richardsiae]|uniref:Uncharacterized protein n=1 Tax=Pleurostoma richardsiae TaxID=41990 RepID=A0AA38S9X8_9PEZI|nr:hypothetical protein NKR23_g2630 [Pleurostoma richardsiae]